MSAQQIEGSIQDLRQRCLAKEGELRKLREELEHAERALQRVCHHEFVATDNGDYHKPGYYYTCEKCRFWSMTRPSNYPVRKT